MLSSFQLLCLCFLDLQLTKVTNANMNHDMECLKKDDGQITKELEESKALHDLQQNFIEEIEKVTNSKSH